MQKYNFNKSILSDFSGNNLTGLGGILSIGEFLNTTLNLEKLLKKSIKENSNPKKITHGKVKVIIQKIYGILAGYKTNNIDKYIKNDPVFKELLGTVVPKTTVNRVLNTFGKKVENGLQKIILEIEKYNILANNKEKVIIDIDTTYDPASENIEKATFNTHYGTTGYSPILAFDGLTGDLIMGELRPGNFACSKDALEFIEKIVNFYEKNNVSMKFRLDSGFATPKIYEYLEWKGIKYYIKLKSNSVLKRELDNFVDINKLIPGESIFTEFEYGAKSWDNKKRIIACIDWINQETKESKKSKSEEKQYSLIPFYSFIVTNDTKYSEKEVFSMYNGRATIETLIEEGKNGFFMDKLSHQTFNVNSAVFQIHMLAISVFQLFRKMTTGIEKKEKKEYKKEDYDGKFEGIEKIGRKVFSLKTIETFRLELFRIPARVVRIGRKLLFRFESSFGGKELYNNIMAKINTFTKLEISP